MGATSPKPRVAAFVTALALGACGGSSVRHTEQGGAAGAGEAANTGGTAGMPSSGDSGTGGGSDKASGGVPSGFSSTGGASGAGPGNGCCTKDADCGPIPCVNGYCADNTADVCARDDACPAGEVCSGAFFCVCGEPCARSNSSGSCVPANAGCCISDDDCGDGECVRGVCKSKLDELLSCWRTSDCAAYRYLCVGANVCACGTSCFAADTPGTCQEPFK